MRTLSLNGAHDREDFGAGTYHACVPARVHVIFRTTSLVRREGMLASTPNAEEGHQMSGGVSDAASYLVSS